MEIDKPVRIVWANQSKNDLLNIMEHIKIAEATAAIGCFTHTAAGEPLDV